MLQLRIFVVEDPQTPGRTGTDGSLFFVNFEVAYHSLVVWINAILLHVRCVWIPISQLASGARDACSPLALNRGVLISRTTNGEIVSRTHIENQACSYRNFRGICSNGGARGRVGQMLEKWSCVWIFETRSSCPKMYLALSLRNKLQERNSSWAHAVLNRKVFTLQQLREDSAPHNAGKVPTSRDVSMSESWLTHCRGHQRRFPFTIASPSWSVWYEITGFIGLAHHCMCMMHIPAQSHAKYRHSISWKVGSWLTATVIATTAKISNPFHRAPHCSLRVQIEKEHP